MKRATIKRIVYFLGFVLLAAAEIMIARFVHDDFVRPYIGDVLVIWVMACFVRIFVPERLVLLPLYLFLFACLAETAQLLNLPALFGLENSPAAAVLLGTTFDPRDILCYLIGCAILALCEACVRKAGRADRH